MEIERKFLIRKLPDKLQSYKSHFIEQAYLNVAPVVRVRRSDDEYYMTYKGSGMVVRTEYNLPLNAESYEHLKKKADGNIITKRRYLIPIEAGRLMAELDVFEGIFKGIVVAEVEFESVEEAEKFVPPSWFGEDVSFDVRFHNSCMSTMSMEDIRELAELVNALEGGSYEA